MTSTFYVERPRRRTTAGMTFLMQAYASGPFFFRMSRPVFARERTARFRRSPWDVTFSMLFADGPMIVGVRRAVHTWHCPACIRRYPPRCMVRARYQGPIRRRNGKGRQDSRTTYDHCDNFADVESSNRGNLYTL